MDTLVTLLIFASLAVLSGWIKRKQRATDDLGPGEEPAAPAPPATPRVQWEQELRRFLGQEEPTPPPLLSPERQPFPTYSEATARPATTTAPAPTSMSQAAASYQRAINLGERVSAQLHHGSSNPATVHPSSQAIGHDHARLALQLLRQNNSLRALFIGSIVLGPPKALGGEKSYD